MNSTQTKAQYAEFRRPSWSPPAWVFGPVWTLLYGIIAVSYGFVGYWFFEKTLSFEILLPFILNLIFNLAYTPIQFRLRNMTLASVDILLILGTLLWALESIYPISPLVTYVNLPYLAWVCFATVLQLTITWMNRKGQSRVV